MSAALYRQCLLRRGSASQVAFIPDFLAKPGAYLKLRGENGWQVIKAWSRKSSEYLSFNERSYRGEFGSLV